MLIYLSSLVYDIDGQVAIWTLPGNTDGATRRRVNRVALLDGDAVTNDGGFSEGDRDPTFTWRSISSDHDDLVARMVRLYSQVYLSTPKGCFLVALREFRPGPPESALDIYVLDRLTA